MHAYIQWLITVALLVTAPAMAEQADIRKALSRPGHALLIRHADAPGTGDPVDFTLGDCSTQRNLGPAGRAQARRLGDLLRGYGIANRSVYSSRWCRCRETAELLDIGPVEPHDGLNSFFGEHYSEAEIMPLLREFLRDRPLDPPPVLVTHQVNITALTGVYPREGEMIVIAVDETGGVDVIGRIAAPE